MLKTIAAIRSNSAQGLVKSGTALGHLLAKRRERRPAPAAQGMHGPVRSTFADTAYWVGDAQTDDNGDGRIAFTWPDDLTTWVAKAVAVDDLASVGQATGKHW